MVYWLYLCNWIFWWVRFSVLKWIYVVVVVVVDMKLSSQIVSHIWSVLLKHYVNIYKSTKLVRLICTVCNTFLFCCSYLFDLTPSKGIHVVWFLLVYLVVVKYLIKEIMVHTHKHTIRLYTNILHPPISMCLCTVYSVHICIFQEIICLRFNHVRGFY